MNKMLLVVAILLLPVVSAAAWSYDPHLNNPVCTDPATQGNAMICSDQAGGYLFAWVDLRAGGDSHDIYMQHFDAHGQAIWAVDGRRVYQSSSYVRDSQICTDDSGGVYILFSDVYSGVVQSATIQHVTATGGIPWGPQGLVVTPDAMDSQQIDLALAPDGFGGAYIVWSDFRNGGADLWGQRVSPSGLGWSSTGLNICNRAGDQYMTAMAACPGGVVLCWKDYRDGAWSHYDIYAQRLDGGGTRQWTFTGVPVCTQMGIQDEPTIASDGNGGAFIAWSDYRDLALTNVDIYAQHLDQNGALLGAYDGVPICTKDWPQDKPQIVIDGGGGAYLIWSDSRIDAFSGETFYAQHLDVSAQPLWNTGGVVICPHDGPQFMAVCGVSAVDGDLIVVWSDERSHGQQDLYAQRMSPAADLLWPAEGLLVSDAAGNQSNAGIVAAADGSCVVAFNDYRAGADIYAQRIDGHGVLGDSAPTLISVDDHPLDQGSVVDLTCLRSRVDIVADQYVTGYDVWRRWLAKSQAWELVGGFAATGADTYYYAAPTLADSCAAGDAVMEFLVAARGGGEVVWSSNIMAGYSLDNIAPGAPLQLTAELSGSTAHLSWQPSGVNDEDLSNYDVYRSEVPGFEPSTINFRGSSTGTSYDDHYLQGGNWYYVVTAEDVHDNQSGPSNEAHVAVPTGLGETPDAVAGLTVSPNPFNPSTLIRYHAPRAGRLVLAIYAPDGRRVRTLCDAAVDAGDHAVRWDGRDDDARQLPSGVYVARADVGGCRLARKIALVR